MGRIFLSELRAGDVIEDVVVVSGKQFAQASNGKHYIKCLVGDRSAQFNARMWNATREIFEAIPDAGFLRIRGRVENYQQNTQVIIESLWPAQEGSYDPVDLLPHTEKDIPTMCRQVTELCQSVQNRHVAAILQEYLDDQDLMANVCKAPAATSYHHAFIGGLLEHTLNAMTVGDCIARFWPGLNRDLVLAGIFLHDIAKTWELKYDNAFAYSDGGMLVGHIVKSAIWLEQKAEAASRTLGETIPRELIDVLQHIIISHHGELQFGAAKTPATAEAIAVHFIENLDAKLNMALAARRGTGNGSEGNWTEYLKQFGGRLYRPDVAPEDAPIAEPPAEPALAKSAAAPAVVPAPAPTMKITNPLFEQAGKKR